MEDGVRHNCGFCVAHTLHDAYSFIRSLQHRGREAAGIAAVGDGRIDVIKWEGGVDRFDVTDLHKIFPSPNRFFCKSISFKLVFSGNSISNERHN